MVKESRTRCFRKCTVYMIFLCFWNKLFLRFYKRYKVIFAAKFRFSIIENLSGLLGRKDIYIKDLSELHLNRIETSKIAARAVSFFLFAIEFSKQLVPNLSRNREIQFQKGTIEDKRDW